MAPPYPFPIRPQEEILKCLRELDFPFSDAEYAKPTPEAVKPLYQGFVQLLMQMTREELQQPVFHAMAELEYPELHDDSIGDLASFRALQKLMKVAGVNNFCLKDMHMPDTLGVRRNLSALLNYVMFREDKLQTFQEHQDRSDSLLERKQQLEEENLQLTSELKRIEAERAADRPAVEELERETSGLQVTIVALNKEQAALNKENHRLKQQANELADQLASEKFALLEAHQERAELRGKIVESPEKLQRTLEELGAAVERERAAIGEAERRARDLQAKLECCGKVEREVMKTVKLMEEAEAEIAKYKTVSRDAKAAKAKIKANEDTAWELDRVLQHLQRQHQSAMERLQRLEQQGALKREAAVAALEEARALKAEAEAEHKETMAKLTERQTQTREVQAKIADVRSAHEQEIALLTAKYDSLQGQVHKYHDALAGVMETPPARPPRPVLA
ncbi:hypothetical protein KFL_000540390 [Klebsormidium nitens]|uniref:Uncharacterized protein n=1 Tax=Klebsormidium nitens TaxID=105231 RepID=A0A0U9HIA3_KLENI|nr:hypothetical protein KFL_000540390 [Klebsormidium nitens]|eukprot:GAQ80464.1 hypothetical protein KFL_000540390 [Klebsormidium nitens]